MIEDRCWMRLSPEGVNCTVHVTHRCPRGILNHSSSSSLPGPLPPSSALLSISLTAFSSPPNSDVRIESWYETKRGASGWERIGQ